MKFSPSGKDLIDIHSHSGAMEAGTFKILNVFTHDYVRLPGNLPISIGLHPWYITANSEAAFEGILQQAAHLSQVKAIGETGMDRLCGTDLQKQEEIFKIHIRIALQVGKPLIIHCVRAYPELIRLKNLYQSEISWIIHGFNGNTGIAEKLIDEDFYLSIGKRMLRSERKSREFCSVVPIERLFIETDDDQIPLPELYNEIAGLYNVEFFFLQEKIMGNYLRVFKRFDHEP